jgi:hypothetical protein
MPPGTESWRALALACALLAWPAAAAAQPVVPSPPAPTSRVLWQHDGAGVAWFEVRVDGRVEARVEPGEPSPGGHHEAPLPLMLPGLRSLVVAACNAGGCGASAPLVVLVVSGPIRWVPAVP